MKWYPNKGVSPRDTSVLLAIEWACGKLARHAYTAKQLRWSLTGHDYDIGRFARMEG